MKLFSAFLATIIYIAVLCVIYYIHMRYFRVDVVFYAVIADGFIAGAITALVIFGFNLFHDLSVFEKWLLVVIWLLGGYCFAISVPTVIDRSLSFYILEKLEQRGGGILQNSFEQVFTHEYVKEHRLVDVRLTEQLQSGTIEIKEGCVVLTDKGKSIVKFSKFFRHNFLPKKRLLLGEYSEVLTDPFQDSEDISHYKCS